MSCEMSPRDVAVVNAAGKRGVKGVWDPPGGGRTGTNSANPAPLHEGGYAGPGPAQDALELGPLPAGGQVTAELRHGRHRLPFLLRRWISSSVVDLLRSVRASAALARWQTWALTCVRFAGPADGGPAASDRSRPRGGAAPSPGRSGGTWLFSSQSIGGYVRIGYSVLTDVVVIVLVPGRPNIGSHHLLRWPGYPVRSGRRLFGQAQPKDTRVLRAGRWPG